MSVFKDHTKFNFFEGAIVEDKFKLFNGGLDSKKHRSIDLKKWELIDETKLNELISSSIKIYK